MGERLHRTAHFAIIRLRISQYATFLVVGSTVRMTLISALAQIAPDRCRQTALEFLQGLSGDELQYIAEFFGSLMLECGECAESRTRLAEGVAAFLRAKDCPYAPAASLADRDHKTILLLEYLGRSGMDVSAA